MFEIGDRVELVNRACGDTWEDGDEGVIESFDGKIWEVRTDDNVLHDVFYDDQMELV